MIKGVTEKEYSIIKNILNNYTGEFYAYGSRVNGDFSALSDLDILVKSDNYDRILPELKQRFDMSSLPYVVNFTNYSSIDKKFYKLIENSLVKI